MDDRRRFLDERRAISRRRFDELHAPVYDDRWGATRDPLHLAFVARLLDHTAPGEEVLDAACGTGKYWPDVLGAGRRVFGTDQSDGMLARASAKHPGVPTRRVDLQDLAREPDLSGRFAGLLCVDAMENVGPEDWPRVLDGFRAVLRPGSSGYLSVEVFGEAEDAHPGDAPPEDGAPLLPGEIFLAGGGYHYYPERDAVFGWLAGAGFALVEEAADEEYWHLLVRRDAT